MTDTTKKTRKRKPKGLFTDELIDQLLSQARGKDAESLHRQLAVCRTFADEIG